MLCSGSWILPASFITDSLSKPTSGSLKGWGTASSGCAIITGKWLFTKLKMLPRPLKLALLLLLRSVIHADRFNSGHLPQQGESGQLVDLSWRNHAFSIQQSTIPSLSGQPKRYTSRYGLQFVACTWLIRESETNNTNRRGTLWNFTLCRTNNCRHKPSKLCEPNRIMGVAQVEYDWTEQKLRQSIATTGHISCLMKMYRRLKQKTPSSIEGWFVSSFTSFAGWARLYEINISC